MATPTPTTPTTEPSSPDQRKARHFPLKSYASAVEKSPFARDSNGATGEVNGMVDDGEGAKTNGSAPPQEAATHKASVLRIVNIAPETQGKSGSGNLDVPRPEISREVSKEEYSAKVGPFMFNGRLNTADVSQGLDDHPTTPIKSIRPKKASSQKNLRSHNRGGSDGNSSENTINGATKEGDIFEMANGSRGSNMSSLEGALSKKEDQKVDKVQRDKIDWKEESLASGRIAGRRWGESGIRFAPMNIPLQRRLQTLVVLLHTLCIAISVSIFFFLCAIPLFWPLLIPYMIYCLTSKASTSGSHSHRLEFMRRSPIWSLFASYFPARLYRTQELPPTRKYIFGYHPHGIISMGAFGAFATEAMGFSQLFPGIKNTLLTLDSNFRIPLYRDYALAMGISSVSKESCENLLTKGGPNNVCLYPIFPRR